MSILANSQWRIVIFIFGILIALTGATDPLRIQEAEGGQDNTIASAQEILPYLQSDQGSPTADSPDSPLLAPQAPDATLAEALQQATLFTAGNISGAQNVIQSNLNGGSTTAYSITNTGIADIAADGITDTVFRSTSNTLYRHDLNAGTETAVTLTGIDSFNGVFDIDPLNERLYLFGVVGGNSSIIVAEYDGTFVTSTPISSGVTDMAVDPVGQNVYWTAPGQMLHSLPLSGGTVTTNTIGADVILGSFDIDALNSRLYFTGKVNSADASNSVIETNFTGGFLDSFTVTGGVSDMAVDPINGRVYRLAGSTLYRHDISSGSESTITISTSPSAQPFQVDVSYLDLLVTLEFTAAATSGLESVANPTIATMTTTNNNTLTEDVSARLNLTGGTATNGVDYSRTATNFTIPTGTAPGTLALSNLSIVDDTIYENPDETVELSFSNVSGLTLGTQTTTTYTILNNDQVIGVEFTQAASSGDESVANPTLVTVTTGDGQPTEVASTVTLGITGGTPNSDYTLTDPVTIPAGTASGTSIPLTGFVIIDDTDIEPDETLNLTLTNATGVDIGTQDTATYTILDNDTAAVSLSTSTITILEDGGTATITATLDAINGTGSDLIIPITVNIASTAAGTDYTIGTLNLTIPDGGTTGTTTLTGVTDTVVEPDETVILDLGTLPAKTTAGSPTTVTVTIVNDDTATVTLTGTTSQNEGNAGTTPFVFTATLSAEVVGGFTVAFTSDDGTATTADSDYVNNDNSLTFTGTAGETQTITILVNGDTTIEPDETFTVNLGAISSTSGGLDPADILTAGSPQTGTILNDDLATVTLSSGLVQNEGNAGAIAYVFTATLDVAVNGGFDLAYTSDDGTATEADGDYVNNDGTLNFSGNAGETQTFTVNVNGDTKVETDETFSVALGSASNTAGGIDPADILTAATPQTNTITNDDSAIVTLSGTSSQLEGDSGTVAFVFTATLNTAVQGGFNVTYTSDDGTASTADADYVNNDNTLTFSGTAGETQTFTVLVNGDTKVEEDETFTVSLGAISGTTGGVETADITTAGSPQTGTILNDDSAIVTLSGPAPQNEGNIGATPFVFTATLNTAVQGGFDLAFTTDDGTATLANSDYNDNDGSISFTGNAGETQTITVNVVGDTVIEADETFTVNLGAISGTAGAVDTADITTAGSPQTATILNDDFATVTLSGGVAQDEGDAGFTPYVFTATLDIDVAGGFTVTYNTNDGTATTADGDYNDNDGTLIFTGTAGETQTFTVNVNGDTTVEADETFTVALGTISDTANGIDPADILTAASPQTATITNDDTATVTLSGTASQLEGDAGTVSYTFTATLSADVQGGFNIAYTSDDGTATTADNDYVNNDGTLNFTGNAGETLTIIVNVNGDTVIEADETFTVNLGAVSGTAGSLDPADILTAATPQTATILNDDTATVTLSGGTAQNEGDAGFTPFVFTATLDVNVSGGFTVTYNTNDGTATTADNDYVNNDSILTFTGTAGETQLITVNINGDTRVEDDETFTVTLGTTGGTVGGIDPADILLTGSPQTSTILNDDTATVTLSAPAPQNEGDLGTTPFVFTATLDVDVAGGFDLAFTTDDGTATLADSDYNDNDGTLNFTGTAGETLNITVQVNGDPTIEADETFNVNLGAISGTAGGVNAADISTAASPQTATILNDDLATVTLSGGIAQNEGDTGITPYIFTATLDIAVAGGFTVTYSSNDATATTADSDYADNDGTLTFTGTAGETQTFTVNVNGDSKVEGDETFTTVLGNTGGTSNAIDPADILTAATPQTATITNDDSAVVTLSGAIAQLEGDTGTITYTFTATLSADVQGGFDLAYTTDDGTATTADNDYVNNDGTLNFSGTAGETQTVIVVVNGDTTVEEDETFTVNLGAISGTTGLVDPNDITTAATPQTGTITNDDAATVTLSGPAPQNEGNLGTTPFVFTATLDAAVQGGFDLAFTTDDGTATTADNDYVNNDGTLNFTGTAGETLTITVDVVGDTVIEADETFTVNLGAVSGTSGAVDPADIATAASPQTGTILNDDFATITLSGGLAQDEGDAGFTPYVFTATLDIDVAGGFTVTYNTNDGTATVADGDYNDNDGTLIFAGTAGETQTFTVNVNGDTKVEADETFTVTLGTISDTANGIDPADIFTAASPQTATITNDDAAIVTLSGGIAQLEGDSGTISYTFTATLSADVQGGFNLAYTSDDGTATTADGDYVNNDNTLTFTGNAGETQTVTVLVNGDTKVETDEAFTVNLGAVSGTVGGVNTADITTAASPQTGTILNDDAALVTLSGTIAQDEGDAGFTPFIFTATLDVAVQGGFTVTYTTDDGTATIAGNDYVNNDNLLTFTGNAGETQTITVNVIGDMAIEEDETFTVSLGTIGGTSGGVNAADITSTGSPQTGTITNDDLATVTLSAPIPQNEGNSGITAFVFTATVDAAVAGGFTVAYTTNDGTATTGNADYIDNDSSLTFVGNAGETQFITVGVNGDTTIEADETFSVSLGAISGTSGGVDPNDIFTAGSPQTGTILNDDFATVTLSGGTAQNEEDSGQVSYTFTATLDIAVSGGFTMTYTTDDGTATTADGDYVNNDGTLTFSGIAGETQTITVLTNGDTVIEADETFTVNLGNASGTANGIDPADILTADTPQTATILNDDLATVTLSGGTAQTETDAGNVTYTFTATLDIDVGGGFSMTYTINDGTATAADSDYIDNDGTLVFAGTAGETQTITVDVNGDTKVEADETFTVALGSAFDTANGIDPADILTADTPQTATITNDDTAVITLSGTISQTEGNLGTTNFIFTATLDAAVQDGFTVAYTNDDGTATTADNDYVNNDSLLNFTGTAGETQTITVTVNGDTKVESDETFTVSLGAVSGTTGGVETADITATGSPQTGTILNDDTAIVTLSGGIAQNEGDTGTTPYLFTATLNVDVAGGFDVAYTTDDGTATTADNDYVNNDNILNFAGNAGETQTITVLVNGDGTIEADETFTVNLGAISGTSGGIDPADITTAATPQTGTILNDDLATVTFSGSTAQDEGNLGTIAYTFTATLDIAVTGGFTLTYTTDDDTATTADNDYVNNDGILTFAGNAGETQTITVLVNGDTKVEADETFDVNLGTVGGTAGGIDPADILTAALPQTGTITNDDSAIVTLSGTSAQLEGDIGTTDFVFTATLSADVQGGFDVAYTSDDGTATVIDNDYVNNDSILSFAGTAGETQLITVTVNSDTTVEADETFIVNLGTVSGAAVGVDTADITTAGSPQTGTILNDDTATVTLTGTISQTEGNAGLTPFVFTATLDTAVQGGFTIAYTTDDGTATLADNDYVDGDSTLTFTGNAGETQFVTVSVNGDMVIEPDETFTVNLGAISGTSGAIDTADISTAGSPQTGTILNDDFATVTLSGGTAQDEEDVGTVSYVFSATLDIAVAGGFTVTYTTDDGTATTADNDYVNNDSALTFAGGAGETQTITVTVNSDTKVEADETFTVNLGIVGGTAGGIDPADILTAGTPQTGTVTNDDTATVTLSGGVAQLEGDIGTTDFVFTATLNVDVQGGFNVAYTTDDGTATTADNDYVNNDNTLTFTGNAGETQIITVTVNSDTVIEGDETFDVNLGAVSGTAGTLDPADILTAGSPQTGTILNDDLATVTLSGGITQTEGNLGTTAYIFTATLDVNVSGGFTVTYTSDNGTATTADNDYVNNDGTLAFAGMAGETQTITVLVNGDDRVEQDETFTVNLGTVSDTSNGIDPADILIADSPQTGTIANDDTATVTLSGAIAQSEGDAGTVSYTFTATLNVDVVGGFTVAYTTDDGTATTADSDYVNNDNSLTFAGSAGETQTITVLVNGDTILEADETFDVNLGAVSGTSGGVDAADINTAGSPQTGTILNDDLATVTLSGGIAQDEGDVGITAYTFTATVDIAVAGGFTVTYTTDDGTAAEADNDYVNNDGTLAFTGNAAETQTITVNVNGDTKVEADETFDVTLGTIGGTVGGLDTADILTAASPQTATITNDDSAIVTLSGPAPQTEGDVGTTSFVFTATLNVDVQDGFDLAYTSDDGTATTADNDYVNNDNTLTFTGNAGETQTITVDVNGDTVVEADETFNVNLGAVSGTTGVSTADITTVNTPQTGTILNDDIDLVITAVNSDQAEGDAGTTGFTYLVTRIGDTTGATTVDYAVTGGAVNPADAADFGGVLPTGTVNFATGDITQTLTIDVSGDVEIEPDETFTVTLSNPSGNAEINTTTAAGLIRNDDLATVTLSGGIAQNEGDVGPTAFVFTATLDIDVTGGFELAYTTNDGTATTADGDYADNDGTLTFAGTAGEMQTITININGDTTVEADETFTVLLGAVSNTAGGIDPADILTAASPQTSTILNDDIDLTITAADADKAEGNTGATPFTFLITRLGDTSVNTSVDYVVSGSGANPADAADFGGLFASGTVTLTAGQVTQTLTITVAGDTTIEPTETFTVMLSNPSGNAEINTATAAGTIQNDDQVTVTLSGGLAQNEGDSGTVTYLFTATLDNAVAGGFTLAYSTDDGTATTADNDYVNNDDTLSFAGTAGETQTIAVQVNGDTVAEDTETFAVNLGAVSDTAGGIDPADILTAGSPQIGTIINDDFDLAIAAASADQLEGDSGATAFTFTVTRVGESTDPVTVDYTVIGSGVTPADAADFGGTFPSGTVSFSTSQFAQTVTIAVQGDTTVEPDEGFTVILSNPSAGAQVVTGTAVGTIQNDDAAVITLSGGIAQDEGANGTTAYLFTATLNNPVSGGFNIAYSTNDGTATTADDDYIENNGSLTFSGAANEAQTITVNVNGDTDVEDDETFTVSLGAISGTSAGIDPADLTTAGSPQTGTILNDDANPNLYLPLVYKQPRLPDLVVDSVRVTSTDIEVVIRNAGTRAVTSAYWVDAYIGLNDPSRPPTAPNDIWQLISPQGIAWGVDDQAGFLEPGETLTLRLNDRYQNDGLSSFTTPLASGTPIYIQVDSANAGNNIGGILEIHEQLGTPYNNVSEPVFVP